MKSLKQIRSDAGLTQHELAELLGVSRSHLSLVEVSDRYLNGTAIMSLAQIKDLIKEKEIEIETLYNKCDIGKIIEEYNRCLNNCIRKRLTLEIRLQQMENDFAKARAVYIVYSHQKENNKEAVSYSVEKKLRNASSKIRASGKFQQELLRAQIRQLTAEEAGWSESLEEFSKIQPPMRT